MRDFRHQLMTPEQITAPRHMDGAPIGFRIGLLRSWLLEATGETTDSSFANTTCNSETYWSGASSSRFQLGAITISDPQFDQLLDLASNSRIPEPTTVITESERIIDLVGFDVWGMGQHQEVLFYRGDFVEPSEEAHIQVPDGYWFLKNSVLL